MSQIRQPGARWWSLLTVGFWIGWSAWAAAQAPWSQGLDAEARRLLEIQVELAWLADPLTFPYFLEARVEGQTLEVHGHVPSREVRAQACKLARLYCPLTVKDAMKEHASLAVRPVRMHPEQLRHVAATSLRLALPGQETLVVGCDADGQVTLTGSVGYLEEKLSASQALRRLHGCRCVSNQLVTTSVETRFLAAHHGDNRRSPSQQRLPLAPSPTTIVQTGTAPRALAREDASPVSPLVHHCESPAAKKTDQASPGLPGTRKPMGLRPPAALLQNPAAAPPRPTETATMSAKPGESLRLTPVVKLAPGESPGAKRPVPAAEALSEACLQQRLAKALGAGRRVEVRFLSPTQLRVELQARNEAEANQLAEQIFALLDLPPSYRIELNLQISP